MATHGATSSGAIKPITANSKPVNKNLYVSDNPPTDPDVLPQVTDGAYGMFTMGTEQ